MTYGDGVITVRPISAYADEGPSVWKTNYLAPVRFALVPIYLAAPGPRTLLVIQNVVFWWVIPAAFTLVRSETRSDLLGLAASALVPLTPMLWPLVWNDFRELQMALPFVLWAVQGVRGRDARVAALGVVGMLACRQEFALVVMTLAILPAREPEDVGRTYRWAHGLIVIGLGWFLFGFFGYLRFWISKESPRFYCQQFVGGGVPLTEAIPTAMETLVLGLGAWSVFLVRSRRVALLMLPWLWSLANGRWSSRFLATEQWHHVRYTALFVALALAAGLVGFAKIGAWLLGRPWGRRALALTWVAAAVLSATALGVVVRTTGRQPRPVDPAEVAAVWRWVGQVGPDDGVLATYEVTAPLSSRQHLYSYILQVNEPPGFPKLGPEIQWVFCRHRDNARYHFDEQGFTAVHRGPHLAILRRPRGVTK
jgi:hypothetical protein